VNVERWIKTRTVFWRQLEDLLKLIDQKGLSSLNRQQLQELGRLYRSASADLSRARALKLGQDLQVYLNNLVVKAHNQVYQTTRNRWTDLVNFLWLDYPALVRKYILYVALSFTIFAVPTVIAYCSTIKDVHFAQMEVMKNHPLVDDALWTMIERKQMWTDAVENISAPASSLIATNNIRVAILAFACGITFGIGTCICLITNGLSIGTIFGVCRLHGMDSRLLAFVAPHGILELSAIFISGAAGLLIAKALLFPGQYRRIDALRILGKDAVRLFVGCIPILLVAGCIEGFVSPRTDLNSNIKFGVGLATLLCLFLYLFIPRDKKIDP
jgi:uncharacterized membrane protein SpoIIM required for sporulation